MCIRDRATSLFSTQPALAANGTLTYTPAANASGSTVFDVNVQDSGGGDNSTDIPSAFTITVNAVNDAPVLTTSGGFLTNPSGNNFTARDNFTTILEDPATNNGDNVSTFLNAAAATDVELGNAVGIAVTEVTNTNGDWQFSINNGTSFTDFGVVSASSARLLDGGLTGASTHKVRFVPDTDFNGTATIKYRAWDKTTGSAGNTANTSTTA